VSLEKVSNFQQIRSSNFRTWQADLCCCRTAFFALHPFTWRILQVLLSQAEKTGPTKEDCPFLIAFFCLCALLWYCFHRLQALAYTPLTLGVLSL